MIPGAPGRRTHRVARARGCDAAALAGLMHDHPFVKASQSVDFRYTRRGAPRAWRAGISASVRERSYKYRNPASAAQRVEVLQNFNAAHASDPSMTPL